jgi:hypothetical protein
MAYNIGALLFDADYSERFAELLRRIEPGTYTAAGTTGIGQATRREFSDIAAGVYGGKTLVLHQFWPYDCSFSPAHLNPIDERLAALSTEGPVVCLLIDETSMTFGISCYEEGERVRVRQVDPDAIRSDWGEPLPPETPFDPDSHDDSERIMALSEWFLGERLDTLIAEGTLTLTRYQGG